MSSDLKAESQLVPAPLVFGTYRIKGEVLDDSACQALQLFREQGRPLLLDGAAKYGNTDVVMKIMKRFPEAELGWKVEAKSRERSLQAFVQALAENHIPHHRIFRILLHNYAGKKTYLDFQQLVDQEFGEDMMPIGICNITAEQLEDLNIIHSDEADKTSQLGITNKTKSPEEANTHQEKDDTKNVQARVNYVQNEYHPFLQTNVPQICKKHGIHFEAHSTMWGNLEDYGIVLQGIMSSKVTKEKSSDQTCSKKSSNQSNPNIVSQTNAQLAIAYAANALTDIEADQPDFHRNDATPSQPTHELRKFSDGDFLSVCFTTTNYAHLVQTCDTRQISRELLQQMRQMCRYKRVVRYKGSASAVNTNWIESCDVDYIKSTILPQIKSDIAQFTAGGRPSDLCTKIPKHYQNQGKVHTIIAKMLYFEYLKEEKDTTEDQIKLHHFGKRQTDSRKKKDRFVEAWDELDDTDADFANQRLFLILKKMRKYVEELKKDARHKKKVATCTIKAVTNPEALPVDSFPDASEFDDLNKYIVKMSLRQKQSDHENEGNPPVYSNMRFKYGTLNTDGRLDLCKQGVRNAYIQSCKAVIADAGLDLCKQGVRKADVENCEAAIQDGNDENATVRFRFGTLTGDSRLDLCKQGVKKGYAKSCEAVVVDGQCSNTRFQHGTLNSDGRLDLCKQGVKNAYNSVCDAVVGDGCESNVRFSHGTINVDGRLDLCKQGVKKAYINTCEAVELDGDSDPSNTVESGGRPLIKHYLLGNNVIGDDSDGLADVRITALCNMIRNRPDIQTWYLAGNALSPGYIALVADALTHTRARYIWFKMNPVKDGSFSLAKLIQNNQNIELLDLFNCGLCDSGILSFCNTLIETGKNKFLKINETEDDLEENADAAATVSSINEMLTLISETQTLNPETPTKQEELVKSFRSLNFSKLKHIYFGINGITEHGINPLFCILAILSENLESIYIHSNPIKDMSLQTFYDKMTSYEVTFPKLKRFSVGSCGLTDTSLPILKEIIQKSPNLVSLDLSSYKSTNYFGQVHNMFTNTEEIYAIATALKFNATKSGHQDRNYLGLQHALRDHDHAEVHSLVGDIADRLEMNVNGIQYKTEDVMKGGMLVHKNLTKRELSEVVEPYPAIDYIQSIYRNTMKI